MRLAANVVVHNPESKPGNIDSRRLVIHGWSEEVIPELERTDNEQQSPMRSGDGSASSR